MAVLISVRVHPGARKNGVSGFSDGIWQVKVAAPPVKGKANVELIAWLSRTLGASKSNISIVRGLTSRSKVIAIEGLTEEAITAQLSSSSAASK